MQCKDHIAQQYLMQCIIQGFPDEFHVSTLDVLLGALPELQGSVKVHVILGSILDRLARQVPFQEMYVASLYESAFQPGQHPEFARQVPFQEMYVASLYVSAYHPGQHPGLACPHFQETDVAILTIPPKVHTRYCVLMVALSTNHVYRRSVCWHEFSIGVRMICMRAMSAAALCFAASSSSSLTVRPHGQ